MELITVVKLRKTLIISAYPCCGKTYLTEHGLRDYSILDSDSSKFSWIERPYTEEELDGILNLFDTKDNLLAKEAIKNIYRKETIRVRNPNFVKDYINHIKENIGKVDIIFVSSHLEIRQALQDNDIEYYTVYPSKNMLNEWVGRMYRRGNDIEFINKQIEMWDKNVGNIDNEPHGRFIYRLNANCGYIGPVVEDIIEDSNLY